MSTTSSRKLSTIMNSVSDASVNRVLPNEENTQSVPPRKEAVRHRAALAFEECGARKRRCDGAHRLVEAA